MNSRFAALRARIRSQRVLSSLVILLTLAVGILIGTVLSRNGVRGNSSSAITDGTLLPMQSPQQLSNTFGQVAKSMEPAVVNIQSDTNPKPRRRARRGPGGQSDDPFQDFFDHFFGGQGQGQGRGGEGGGDDDSQSPFGFGPSGRERSLGSGVILNPNGYIMTNFHVIDGADRVRVKLQDDPPGVLHEAKVIGSDQETDLAVIKIEPPKDKTLVAARLGDSDKLNVGDWVLAIGDPFDLEETVTAGIISAKGRNLPNGRQFQSFIQTDAAINPGNSGGPLVNMAGEVVGINTAIYTQTYGYQGVGFAMPSNTVRDVYEQLIGANHRVSRGSIGVEFPAQSTPALSRIFGEGVVLSGVRPDSPADKAGLRQDDLITSVNGKPVKTGDELVSIISGTKPGGKVQIEYARNGERRQASVGVTDRATLFADQNTDEESSKLDTEPVPTKVGITVHSLTQEQADRLGLKSTKGVMVTDVKPGSFGEDLQMQPGLVILEINKQPVNSEEDFRRITTQLKSGQDVVFLVRTGRGPSAATVFLSGTLP